jgi:hypothetical protein
MIFTDYQGLTSIITRLIEKCFNMILIFPYRQPVSGFMY